MLYFVDLDCVDLSLGLCGGNLGYGDVGVVFALDESGYVSFLGACSSFCLIYVMPMNVSFGYLA